MINFPKRLFLEITTKCNLKCELCKLWQTPDPPEKIDLKTKISFLKDVIDFNWVGDYKNQFTVHLTGGEPFLYPEQVFEIAKVCKDNDINCYVNTNGTLVEAYMDKILKSGLTALIISIDSHIGMIHDKMRGWVGLFDHIIMTIKGILSKIDQYDYPLKIWIQSILGNWNINSLKEHINFFKNLRVDGLMFQPIQYTYGRRTQKNWHKDFDKFPNSSKDIQKAVAYMLKLKQNNDFIFNSKEEISLWESYFRNPEQLPKHANICKASEQNIIVDIYGNVKFCFWKYINPMNKIGNILTTSIDDIWNGKTALRVKKQMKHCNKGCGIMVCSIDIALRKEYFT